MQRNRFIDLLKGICILFVIVTHYAWLAEERSAALFYFWIEMAVPVFMIISGFVFFKSFERNGISDFEKAYHPQNVLPKILRYTIPFVIAFTVQVVMGVVRGAEYRFLSLIKLFVTGGQGPGSYYYPLMIQFVFLFPLIYMLVKSKGFKGVIACGVLNLVFEFSKWAYGMNEDLYRLLIFRYILLIAFGCYLATMGRDYKPNKYLCVASFVAGASFIIITSYIGYRPIVFAYWTSTCFVSCLYILPIAMFLILKCRFGFKPLELLGKASFHIFLAQMIYYYSPAKVYAFFENRALQLLISVLICVVVGVVFYFLETPLSKLVIRKLRAYYRKTENKSV